MLAPDLSCIESEPVKTIHHNGRSNCPIILETYSTDVMEEEAIADEVLELFIFSTDELEELATIPDGDEILQAAMVSPPEASMDRQTECLMASQT